MWISRFGCDAYRAAKVLAIPRLILIPAIFFALYEWGVFFTTFNHPGALCCRNWNAPGQDWMVFYSAARSVIDHNSALIFDGARLTSFMNKNFAAWLSQPLTYHPFLNPPSFLLLAIPFAFLGFLPSYAAFQGISAGGLAFAIARNADQPAFARLVLLSALISPAAAITVVTGQLSFLVAFCMIAGMRTVEKRPVLAALFFSLLSLKPQFLLLVPLALIADRQWRCLLYLGLFCALSVILTAAFLGMDIWFEWVRLTVQNTFLPDREWMVWNRNLGNSVYACAVGFGLSPKIASNLQLLALIASAVLVFRAFRSSIKADLKLAVLLVGTLLSAPHSGPYDCILLVIGSALWLAETKPSRGRLVPWALLLAFWMFPVVSPPFAYPAARFVPFFMLAFMLQASTPAGESKDQAFKPAS